MQSMQTDAKAYPSLCQTGQIGSLMLSNRIMMGSMHMGLEGKPDELARLCDFYRARAEGMAALIITGGVAVVQEGGADDMFVLTDDEDCRMLKALADAVHEAGGKIAMQLFHSGRYAVSDEIGMQAVAPSPIPSRLTRETPRELSTEEVAATIQAFADGAARAKELGFDAIEVMGSEGYLLNQFMSPLTNQRNDAYGGDFERRMRPSIDVVSSIRQRVGADYPIIFRMSGDDLMPGSTTAEETILLAQSLQKSGANALNIGIGWHESRVPTVQQVVPRGGFASVAGKIREAVSIPVIGANRLNVPEVADRMIREGYLDFVAPARPWLADANYARKILGGDRSALNVCIACNQSCLDHTLVRPHLPVSCLVNPLAGQERLWPMERARHTKRVAVVGGGPAGLEAAVTAARRGHEVVLYEKSSFLGGQFRMAGKIPGKYEFYETIRYYKEMLERLTVTVKMQTEPSLNDLRAFDDVILATGVVPRVPELQGIDLPHVVTYAQVLRDEVVLGRKIAIVGAGGIGCDVSTYLAESRHSTPEASAYYRAQSLGDPDELTREITVMARSDRYGNGIGRSTRWVVKQEMSRLGVQVLTGVSFVEITSAGVVIEHEGQRTMVEADQVILCAGQESAPSLVDALSGSVVAHVVGGARESRGINAARAIREAFEAAYGIGQ